MFGRLLDWQPSIDILDVGGDRLFLMTVRQESSPVADVAEQTVIESIEFEPLGTRPPG